jgi:Uncharacterised nucleotidyltransferase
MPTHGRTPPIVELAVRNLLVDRVTAEVADLFYAAGIDCMLVKGPVIADWLYPDAIRGYGDSDILVAPSDWEQAVALLTSHGFADYLAPMAHPRMESFAGTAFVRGSDNVDLHCTIAGLTALPDEVWNAIWRGAERHKVAGRSIAVPARPAVLVLLALHAAHHRDEAKPLEDLRRGIRAGTAHEWSEAVNLAKALGGVAAFASGLRHLPEGLELARMLGVEEAGSVRFDLRAAGVPTAEGLHELLGPDLTISQRASVMRSELFPKPSFMRWWTPLARRGRPGLLASYPLRWVWLAVKVPGGLLELRRARRRRSRA